MRPQSRFALMLAIVVAALLPLPAAAAPPDRPGEGPPDHAQAHGHDKDGKGEAQHGKGKAEAQKHKSTGQEAKAGAASDHRQDTRTGASADHRQDARAGKGDDAEQPGNRGKAKPADAAGKQDDHAPAGNKGSVKVRAVGTAAHPPAHQPHLECVVQVDFYGFPGPGAHVTLRTHAPTAPTGDTLASATVTFTAEDANPRGNALVGRHVFDLRGSLEGLTYHEQQGYHVKLTVEAEGPQGANTKHKVFWVDCAAPAEGDEESGGDEVPGDDKESGKEDESDDDGVLGGGGDEADEGGSEAAPGNGESGDTTDVRGTQVTRPDDSAVASVGGAADRSARPSGAVLGASGVIGALGQLAQTGLGIVTLLGIALLALAGGAAALRASRSGR